MQTIESYKTDDGHVYTSKDKAMKHEKIYYAVKAANAILGELTEKQRKELSGGKGYFQHNIEDLKAFRWSIYEIAKDGPLKSYINDQKETHGHTDQFMAYEVHPSWFGRVLDGSCPPLEKAYVRIWSIDGLAREWDQPFFASNPTKDAVCVNPENENVITSYFPILIQYHDEPNKVVVDSPQDIKSGLGFVVLETNTKKRI